MITLNNEQDNNPTVTMQSFTLVYTNMLLTSSLSKYWMSSGLRNGRFPDGWSFICFVVRSSACMWKPVMPPIGVGVADNLRAGVRIGT